MESTNQGFSLGGNPSPFSSWGDIGAPYMATLALSGIIIGLPVWLFSTFIVQNTVSPQQSNQQPDDTRVSPSPSSSFFSPSPSFSSLGETSDTKNQVIEKKKKGKEKKKKKPVVQGGNHALSGENLHTTPSKPKSPCVIFKGNHYHQDFPCILRILRDWSPCLHHPVSSTSVDHVESTPLTSENEFFGQKGRSRFPCRLCEGNHALHRCPFLDEAKSVLDNHPTSPQRLPLGYKKLLPSPSPVENPIDIPLLSVETPIIEDKPSESTPDQSQQVETVVDPVLPSEGPPSNDIVSKENDNNTAQILFVNTESDEHGGNLHIPLPQEGSSPFQEIHPAIYSVPHPNNLVVSFNWNLLAGPRLPSNVPFQIIV